MKKLILLIQLFSFIGAFSQNTDSTRTRKHEIGFGFTNIFNLFSGAAAAYSGYYVSPDDYGPTGFGYWGSGYWGGYGAGYWDYSYNFNPGYGVTYKYHLKNNAAIRTGIDFSKNNSTNEGHQTYSVYIDSINRFNLNSTKLVLKVGYQFEKQIKKVMVYGGMDAFYYSNKSDYDIDFSFNANFEETGTSSVKGFGVTPFGGVLFRIGNMFSISTEGRFRLGSYTSKGSYSGLNPNIGGAYSGNNSGKSFETKFSPLGLVSFNIHL